MLGCVAETLKRDMHPVLLAIANLLWSLGWKCRSKTAYGRDTFCTNDLWEMSVGFVGNFTGLSSPRTVQVLANLQIVCMGVEFPQLHAASLRLLNLIVFILSFREEVGAHNEMIRNFRAEFKTARRLIQKDCRCRLWVLNFGHCV